MKKYMMALLLFGSCLYGMDPKNEMYFHFGAAKNNLTQRLNGVNHALKNKQHDNSVALWNEYNSLQEALNKTAKSNPRTIAYNSAYTPFHKRLSNLERWLNIGPRPFVLVYTNRITNPENPISSFWLDDCKLSPAPTLPLSPLSPLDSTSGDKRLSVKTDTYLAKAIVLSGGGCLIGGILFGCYRLFTYHKKMVSNANSVVHKNPPVTDKNEVCAK